MSIIILPYIINNNKSILTQLINGFQLNNNSAPQSLLTATLFSYTANEYLYVTISICCLLIQFERIKPVCRTWHIMLKVGKNLRDWVRNRSNHLNKAILPSDSSISLLASEALIRHNAVYYAQL